MPGVARLGDTHTGVCDHGLPCCPHGVTGVISSASENVNANGRGVARLNDSVVHNCPHCGTGCVSSASGKVNVNGRGAARLGDSVTYPGGGGTIVTASENVSAG
jgi:uncharacterized Zn-binding protein involved in type VI secretion